MKLIQLSVKIAQRDTQDYAPLQRLSRQIAKHTLTTSKNSIEFTYSYFPCHLKVNRDTLALISLLWKCKNRERLTITANSFTKIVDYRSTRRIPPAVAVRIRKFRPLKKPIRLLTFQRQTERDLGSRLSDCMIC